MLTNPFLLFGIAFELVFAAALIYLPLLQSILGTARRRLFDQAILLSFRSSPRQGTELRRALLLRTQSLGS